jgi:hypothetical protein
LAAPIPAKLVKSRKVGGGGTGNYITARTVMNRLDGVVGPANWYDTYTTREDGTVVCTLYIRVGDGWVGKSDIGTESNIEEDKGAFSDAFKRAAVKWGIARELYNDGTVYEHLRKQEQGDIQQEPEASEDATPEPPAESRPTPRAERSTTETDAPHSAELPGLAGSELDKHFGPKSDYDPAADPSEFDASAWTRLSKWMCANIDGMTVGNHASNALWLVLRGNSDAFFDDEAKQKALLDVAEKRDFKRLYAAKIPVCDVHAAIMAHYAQSAEVDPAA